MMGVLGDKGLYLQIINKNLIPFFYFFIFLALGWSGWAWFKYPFLLLFCQAIDGR